MQVECVVAQREGGGLLRGHGGTMGNNKIILKFSVLKVSNISQICSTRLSKIKLLIETFL